MRALLTGLAALIFLGGGTTGARAQSFGNWAWVVVSGDDHAAHGGPPTETLDNARRDVAAGFESRGFGAANLAEFSVRPDHYPKQRLGTSTPALIEDRLTALAGKAGGGCLVYFTSHGSPEGVVVGSHVLPPPALARIVSQSCGERPTAVIVSACFSGVFVPALAAPNRFVFTAARRDRSSFGCGEGDRYPFFDGCVIEDLPAARDFVDLADRVRRCVAAREDTEHMRPRSEPQLSVGAGFRAAAPAFAPAA